jgi:hypothetical protein
MSSLGVPEGRKRPVEGRHARLRKIDNFLPSRLGLDIVFQKFRLRLRCLTARNGSKLLNSQGGRLRNGAEPRDLMA